MTAVLFLRTKNRQDAEPFETTGQADTVVLAISSLTSETETEVETETETGAEISSDVVTV